MFSLIWGRAAAVSVLALAIAGGLQGCKSIPDVVYHPVCQGAASCPDEKLRAAVEVRDDVRIGPYGWAACVTDEKQELDGSRRLVEDARCSEEERVTLGQVPYHEAWLEYNAEGKPHDHWQREAILRWIQSQAGPLHITVYIHGWHHNADTTNGDPRNNAHKFALMMARQVDSLKRLELTDRLQPRQVLGIYVGWQGERHVDALRSLLSVDSRSKVADKIGGEGLLKSDLLAIADAMRARGGAASRMTVYGHSFGGRMLTSAFGSELNGGRPQPLGAGTTIVTINAALSANCFNDVLGSAQNNPRNTRPTWLNITSENDWATRSIYPVAVGMNLVDTCHPGADTSPKTIGHYQPYLNRSLDNVGCTECDGATEAARIGGIAVSSEPRWFEKSQRLFLAFPRRTDDTLEPLDALIRSINLGDEPGDPLLQLPMRSVWNVRSDRSVLDFGIGGFAGTHNGYVSTILMRLLTELQYPELGARRGDAAQAPAQK